MSSTPYVEREFDPSFEYVQTVFDCYVGIKRVLLVSHLALCHVTIMLLEFLAKSVTV